MKAKRINYRSKTIERLIESTGVDRATATTEYNRYYRSALAEAGAGKKGINTAREVYASLFYTGENIFHIEGKKLVLNELLKGETSIGYEQTMFRMADLYNKFAKDSPALQKIFQEYKEGKISKSEFNANIKDWKKLNIKYMISGSK